MHPPSGARRRALRVGTDTGGPPQRPAGAERSGPGVAVHQSRPNACKRSPISIAGTPTGAEPVQVVSEVLGVSARTAARYVDKCRSDGLLPPREKAK